MGGKRGDRGGTTPFHVWLQATMDRMGWTQRDLAREMGVPPATVSRWMAEGGLPNARTIFGLAEALGADPVALMRSTYGGEDAPTPEPPSELASALHLVRSVAWTDERLSTLRAIVGNWRRTDALVAAAGEANGRHGDEGHG